MEKTIEMPENPQVEKQLRAVYAAFVKEYPAVSPEDIPEEVWARAQQEGSLVAAYRRYEIDCLKEKLAALEKNAENEKNAVGPAAGDGEPAGTDPVIAALLA